MKFSQNDIRLSLLNCLFHAASSAIPLTLYEFEVKFNMSGQELRACLEDLKNCGYVIESERGFEISDPGMNFSLVRWA